MNVLLDADTIQARVRELASEIERDYPPGEGVGAYAADVAGVRHGVLFRASMDSLCFAPPLVITEAELDEMFARVRAALDDTLDWLAARGLAPKD